MYVTKITINTLFLQKLLLFHLTKYFFLLLFPLYNNLIFSQLVFFNIRHLLKKINELDKINLHYLDYQWTELNWWSWFYPMLFFYGLFKKFISLVGKVYFLSYSILFQSECDYFIRIDSWVEDYILQYIFKQIILNAIKLFRSWLVTVNSWIQLIINWLYY